LKTEFGGSSYDSDSHWIHYQNGCWYGDDYVIEYKLTTQYFVLNLNLLRSFFTSNDKITPTFVFGECDTVIDPIYTLVEASPAYPTLSAKLKSYENIYSSDYSIEII
jgi:hypothetical protein